MRKHNRPKLFTIYKKETLTMGVSFFVFYSDPFLAL